MNNFVGQISFNKQNIQVKIILVPESNIEGTTGKTYLCFALF